MVVVVVVSQIREGLLLKADWENHHIEGYAEAALRHGWDAHMFADLLTHTYTHESGGELWQGGCIGGVDLTDEHFNYIVSLYPWEKYVVDTNETHVTEVTAYDSPTQDPTVFENLGVFVADQVASGSKVLVHCQAGLNRSGVVTAMALVQFGFSAVAAIELMREKRSHLVLCNESFEKWVLSQ